MLSGIFSVHNLRYNSNENNKVYKSPGTTIKPEECLPERYSKQKRIVPICESHPNASCPPSCYEVYGKPDDSQKSNDKKPLPPYWKILATLFIAGVTIYAISTSNWFTAKKSDLQKDVSKREKDGRRIRRSFQKSKSPSTSNSFPSEIPYLLIGGGTAAFSAFRSIKSRDPRAKVLVITEEEDLPYMRPPLSKELWYNRDRKISAQLLFKQWNGAQRSIFYEPPEFYSDISNLSQSDKGGVAVATGWKVMKIDVPNKTIMLDDGYEIKYEKCLIATGASPKNLPVFESIQDELKNKIITFRTKEDFLDLEDIVHNVKYKNIVIIGGGFLGSELASSLAHNLPKNKKIYQIYKEKFIMDQVLPKYLSEWATKKSMLEGVNCIANSEVEDYSYKGGQLSLVLSDNRVIDADQVIVAVGVEPNTDLAKASHLETDPDIGGFLVNAELEARSNLWVAGDAACFYDIKLGKPYLHQSMFWSDLGPEIGYEAIGIVDSSLPTVGVFVKTTNSDTSITSVSSLNETTQSSNEEKLNTQTQSSLQLNLKKEKTSECFDNSKVLLEEPKKYGDFGKGVVFYLRNDIVVGIVLWNIFNRMSIARQVLARDTKYDDLNEVAKLFTIHDD
ncbi:Putative apoptosis-inducing factor 1, mitochondrial [Melipona quadrifasciata]|uniref:Putative apoptosis-inducing factor 1, mitochondrial n=1 Tax=Melipona quadrifasciata TaxID=166423 RepID=A0A0M8ZRB3_9HYME|nr:Putative apoptosis-inducing factor 1, mitochondrial [Melipona quadrifasciata]